MRNVVVLTLALMCVPAWSDEIALKDGSKVEWASLRDKGDVYEVETLKGARITVKKEDIDSISVIPAPRAEAPLTGATFTFDAKRKIRSFDLLHKLDLKKSGISGQWRVTNGALIGAAPPSTNPSGADHGKLQFDFIPPEEYDLTVTVARLDGDGDIGFGLVGGESQVLFAFEAWGIWNGLFLVNGEGCEKSGLGVQGKIFTGREPRTATFMVRKDALIVKLEGHDYWALKISWSKVSVSPVHAVPSKRSLFISTYKGTFLLSQVKVTAPLP